jgi:CRP/FNR family transcriptional regulator
VSKFRDKICADTGQARSGRCFPHGILQGTEWRVLGPEELVELCKKAHCRDYEPGETIFREGEACRGVYFISHGLVAVRKEDAEGEAVLLRLASAGDTLGYRPFYAGGPHRASTEVLRNSGICFFDAETMRDLLHDNPELGVGFLRRASLELGQAEQRFYETVRLDLRVRLAHMLLIFKERYGRQEADGRIVVDLPISRQNMAAMIGVRAESLSRAIRHMTDNGLINVSGQRAWIVDLDRLVAEGATPDRH